jgi:leucyl/phenylalanyl-tRNA--protein transferase
MFSKTTDASKIALVALSMQLKAWGFKLIDTQIETPHLNSLGASQISRSEFEALIKQQINQPFNTQKWQLSQDWLQALKNHSKNPSY